VIRQRTKRAALSAAVLGLLCLPATGPARAEAPPARDWTFLVAPFIWLPAMTGDTTVKGVTVDVDTSISDLFTETDFVFAIQAQMEAWYKRRFGLVFSGQWTVLKQDDNLIGPDFGGPGPFPIQFDLKMNMGLFEFFGVYDPGEWELGSEPSSPSLFAQPLVGARVTVMRVEFDAKGVPDLDATKSWADPILGARVGIRFGPDRRWSWRVRGDFGGFGAGSDFTWNLAGLFAYDFHIRSVGATVALGARALYQDFDSGSFGWDVTQYGPLIGLGFRF
jgi:hypothetical protein